MDTVIYDSSWPELKVESVDEALEIGLDMNDYDDGKLSAAAFERKWGIHPDANFVIAVDVS